MAEVIVRIATAAAALLVIAALSVQLRAHDLLANAKDVLDQPHPAAAAVDRRLHDLETVDDLRPGSQASLGAAALELRLRRYAQAVRAARRATEREPDNFSAWTTLALALFQTGDNAGGHAAATRAHALNPFYPVPR